MMETKTIKTYGFGVVAQGFYNYLESNKEEERLHTVIIKNTSKKNHLVRLLYHGAHDCPKARFRRCP